jgi:hypothetical protein
MRTGHAGASKMAGLLLLMSFIWLVVTSVVSVVQLHVNDQAVETWRKMSETRIEVVPTRQPESVDAPLDAFVTAANDAIRSRIMRIQEFIKDVSQATDHLNRMVQEAQEALRRESDTANGAGHAAENVALRARLAERAMRAECSSTREDEFRIRDLVHRLTIHVETEGRDWTRDREQLRRLLSDPSVAELQVQLEQTLDHLEAKMDLVSELWPKWFDEANGDAPISLGLFAEDAEDFPTSAQGRQEYLARTQGRNAAN